MMNYEIFKEVVKEKFMDYMPEKFKGMELVVEPVEKVNVTLDGIILREEGRNISPTIYINDMYKKYQDCGDLEETLMAACDFMERAYEQAPVVDVDSIMRDANEKIVYSKGNITLEILFMESKGRLLIPGERMLKQMHQHGSVVLCQYLVQVKMRNFSHFNPPEAQPQCVFFYTIVRIHLVTYSYNGYEFVSYCRKLPDIQKSTGMPAYSREF